MENTGNRTSDDTIELCNPHYCTCICSGQREIGLTPDIDPNRSFDIGKEASVIVVKRETGQRSLAVWLRRLCLRLIRPAGPPGETFYDRYPTPCNCAALDISTLQVAPKQPDRGTATIDC